MTRFVALLRGVNLGHNKRLTMADLRSMMESLGYTGVKTYLQSGNVTFTADDSGAAIALTAEKHINDELGLATSVIVRSAAELRGIVERNPLEVREPAKFLVIFASDSAELNRLQSLDPTAFAPEELRIGEREIYLYSPTGLQKAKLPVAIEKLLATPTTARNWNTVTNLLTLAEQE